MQEGGKIVYLILDGAGGLPDPGRGKTALQAGRTPNLDRLAGESSCGVPRRQGARFVGEREEEGSMPLSAARGQAPRPAGNVSEVVAIVRAVRMRAALVPQTE